MIISRQFILRFSALAFPFLFVAFLEFVISGRTYWDGTSDNSLMYWLSASLGWQYSEWPFLLYNVGNGFMDRYPSIPETQLAGLYRFAVGEQYSNLDAFFWFGLFLNFLFIIFAAFWGAIISLRVQIPVYILFCSAFLVASHPGMIFTWTSYYHYMALLLPCGLVVCWLSLNELKVSLHLQALFFVLGYALAIQYLAAIPLVSLSIAFAAILFQSRENKIYEIHSTIISASHTHLIATFAIAVFTLGFVVLFLEIPARAAALINSQPPIILALIFAAFGTFCITAILLTKNYAGHFLKTRQSKFFFSTAGVSFIGWIAGANILVFTAWQASFLTSLKWTKSVSSNWSIDQLLLFIFGTRLWLWVIPLILIMALAMMGLCFLRKNHGTMNGLFSGVFILAVLGINFYFMPNLQTLAEVDSAHAYATSRHLASVVITIPVALYWCWIQSKKAGYISGVIAVVISVLSLIDYQVHMAPVSAKNVSTQSYLDAAVQRFREANSNGRVVCYNSHIYRQCMLDFAYKYYIPVYLGNSNNPPLAADFGDPNNRFISQSDINCDTLEKCLSVPPDRNYPILLIAENQNIPKAIIKAGKQIETRVPSSQNLIIMEIR